MKDFSVVVLLLPMFSNNVLQTMYSWCFIEVKLQTFKVVFLKLGRKGCLCYIIIICYMPASPSPPSSTPWQFFWLDLSDGLCVRVWHMSLCFPFTDGHWTVHCSGYHAMVDTAIPWSGPSLFFQWNIKIKMDFFGFQ